MTYAIQCGLKVRISTSTLLEYLNKRVGKYLFRHFLLFSEAYFVHFLLQLTATLYFHFLFWNIVKGELYPKIKLVLFERTLKITE